MTPSGADRLGGPGRPALPGLLMRLFGFGFVGIFDDRSYAVPRHCRQQPSAPPENRGAVFLLAAMGAILLNAPPRDQSAKRATTEWRPVGGRERPPQILVRHVRNPPFADTSDGCSAPSGRSSVSQRAPVLVTLVPAPDSCQLQDRGKVQGRLRVYVHQAVLPMRLACGHRRARRHAWRRQPDPLNGTKWSAAQQGIPAPPRCTRWLPRPGRACGRWLTQPPTTIRLQRC